MVHVKSFCFLSSARSFSGCNVIGSSGHLFRFCELIFVCIVVAMCDLVQDVENIHGLC